MHRPRFRSSAGPAVAAALAMASPLAAQAQAADPWQF